MRMQRGVGDIIAGVIPIYPNVVITAGQAAAMQATTQGDATGMGRLGCTNPLMCSGSAWNTNEPTRGRDIDYAIVGLNGVGDFVPAQFTVPENPIARGGGSNLAGLGCQNGILNGLRGLRGLGAFDTSSLSNFVTSVESGSSTDPIFGITLPNWAWLGGGVLLAAALLGGKSGGAFGRKRNPRRKANPRRRNVQKGFYNQTGFHPLRSSRDYDPDRAGDDY